MVRYALLRKATHHERLLTQRVKTPFALSSPRSGRIEGLAVRQPRFLAIMDRTKRQRHPFMQPAHHIQEIGLHTRPIDQRRADNYHLHPAFASDLRNPCSTSHLETA